MRGLLGFLLLVVLTPGAEAGTRATYGDAQSPARVVIEIADNGDMSVRDVERELRLLLRGGDVLIVDDRLTGPLVTRLADLEAARPTGSPCPTLHRSLPLVEEGTETVLGYPARAFYPANLPRAISRQGPAALISDDPALARVGLGYRTLLNFETRLYCWPDMGLPVEGALIGSTATRLTAMELAPITAADVAPPVAPETPAEVRTRLAEEESDERRAQQMIERAAQTPDGRLWLLTDTGRLSSMAETDTHLRIEQPGDPVIDMCAGEEGILVLTGQPESADWTLRREEGGVWTEVWRLPRQRDGLVGLICGQRDPLILTTRRLIDFELSPRPRIVRLVGQIRGGRVNNTLHATPRSLFVGANAGEWGGGLQRIDRRTGRIARIERNATGGLCDGPLNTACDPVHGIAPLPGRPDCVAVAVGLIHMLAHGRIVSVCGTEVRQFYAARDEGAGLPDMGSDAGAASGRYGSIAFFGLIARGDTLLAAGHDGLYRIGANGIGTRQLLPRFRRVDGVLVSFAAPDVVLVMTQINRRASVSGLAPMLVPRR